MARVVETEEPTVVRETNVVRDEPRSNTGVIVAIILLIIILIALFAWRPWGGSSGTGAGGGTGGSVHTTTTP